MSPAGSCTPAASGRDDRSWSFVLHGQELGLVDAVLGSEPQSLDLPAGDCRVSLLDARGTVLSETSSHARSETTLLDLAR